MYYPAKDFSPGVPWVCILGVNVFVACTPEMEITPYSADSRGLQFLEGERSFGAASDQCAAESGPSSSGGFRTKLLALAVWIASFSVVPYWL